MIYRFGAAELDLARYELRRGGQVVPLQRKIFDVLRYLVEHRDRAVTKQELFDQLWPDEVVTEAVLPWTISHLRKSLGQERGATRPIQTLHGRGYRFTAEVEQLTDSAPGPPPSAVGPPSTGAPTGRTHRFVGRAAVMGQLVGALDSALAGEGALVVLSGEAGIGKTRAAEELASVARARGVSVWVGRCLDGDGVPAFWPWVQILRAARRLIDAEALLGKLTPGAGGTEPASEDRGARFWLLDELSRALLDATEQAPRVLLLDDLHWADEASLDVLLLVAMELRHAPMLVVATARARELTSAAGDHRSLERTLRHARRIELDGFDETDLAAFLTAHGVAEPGQALGVLRAKTGGVPLFVEEVVREWRAGGGAATLADTPIPELARDLVAARVARLSPDAARTLEVASVIGGEVAFTLLRAGAGKDPDQLIAEIEELGGEHLLVPLPTPAHYTFTSDLVREVVYLDLPLRRRAELHLAMAVALDRLGLEGENVARTAGHLYRALPLSEPGRVLELCRRAARDALGLYAFDDAARFLGWALEAQQLEGAAPAPERARLLLEAARAELLASRSDAAGAHLEQALEVALAHDLLEEMVRVGTLLRGTLSLWFVDDPLARRALEAALERLPASEPRLRALASGALARTPPYVFDHAASRRLHERAIELARGTDQETLQTVLHGSLTALRGPEDLHAALRTAEQLTAGRLGAARWRDAEVCLLSYFKLLTLGEVAAAEAALTRFGRLAHELHRAEGVWHHDRYALELEFARGRLDAVELALPELERRARRMRLPLGKSYTPVQTLLIARERHGSVALPPFEDARGELGGASLSPAYVAMLARLRAEAGALDEARVALSKIDDQQIDAYSRDQSYLSALVHLIAVAAATERLDALESLGARLEPFSELVAVDGFGFCQGATTQAVALAHAKLRRPRLAAERFEHAIARNDELGFTLEAVRTRLYYCDALTDGGARGGARRRKAVAREALGLAQSLGLEAASRRAREWL